jgi:hypothetical protein
MSQLLSMLLLRAAMAMLLCTSFVSPRSPQPQFIEIARLLHPLDGAQICSDTANIKEGYLRIHQKLYDATVVISIDDIVVATFQDQSRGKSSEVEFPLRSFPLLKIGHVSLGLRILRIVVFDESGIDLQPEIASEFQIVDCSQPFDAESARESLIISHVSQRLNAHEVS